MILPTWLRILQELEEKAKAQSDMTGQDEHLNARETREIKLPSNG